MAGLRPFVAIPQTLREWERWIRGALIDGAIGTTQIEDGAVTPSKLANVAADTLLGRATAGTGPVETIPCTAAGRALLDDANVAAQRTTLELGTAAQFDVGTSGGTVPRNDTANTWAEPQTHAKPPVVPSYTVAGMPSASPAAQLAYFINESGGPVLAFSDGTDWRRVTDRAVVT